ncbi:MAG: DNA-directed RNA polymerase subunit beta [Deltaproteobacteria bacterium RBG_13_53_10]|nr:MAG: DNA-directed RNA polymerase subunit beta [Deltaproteobacteria bacterium RBG_13_53_10]
MASVVPVYRRVRKDFSKIKEVLQISNLIEVQKRSYDKFLQTDVDLEKREFHGLHGVFRTVFPIKDFYETASLEFVSYRLTEPKYDVEECLLRGMTFAAPIKVTVRLVVWDVNEETRTKSIKAVKEQEVYFGEIPLMTENGTFIINGTERVIVSQLHRSPGVFFDQDQVKPHTGGKIFYYARIIPYRGSWIDFEFDQKDLLYVRIDRRRKIPVTVLLRALKYSGQELLDYFYRREKILIRKGRFQKEISKEVLVGQKATADILDPDSNKVILKKHRRITEDSFKRLEMTKISTIPVETEDLVGKYLARDVVVPETGEVIAEFNEEVTEELLEQMKEKKVEAFEILFIDNINVSSSLRDTLVIDKVELSREEREKLPVQEPGKSIREKESEKALIDIYKRLRPGDPPTIETAIGLFHNLFFNPERYDLSKVGRMKLNHKLGLKSIPPKVLVLTERWKKEAMEAGAAYVGGKELVDRILKGWLDFDDAIATPEMSDEIQRAARILHPIGLMPSLKDGTITDDVQGTIRKIFQDEKATLRRRDILEVVKYLIKLKDGQGSVDDIDHLGNRRVRTVGELLENQYHIGLVRIERAIKERMSLQDVETLMPHDLINSKPLSAVIKEFFGSSQLSQFMDQTNPLSEITHKRRLSALGPGGLTRERAGFEVRDVHPTHYGRICPIETPEGPNIGLITSLSTYARVNDYGFIETPYREVVNGKVTNNIRFLMALDEEEEINGQKPAIAQANAPIDREGRFLNPLISARRGGEFVMVRAEEVRYMDVSPKQLVSVATSLVPFLENDDANRALMGSNMQRQAVPLLRTDAPLIGTGMEGIVARDSGVTIVAKRDGIVEDVDASRIVIRAEEDGEKEGDPGVDIYTLIKYKRSNQNTCINQRPIVQVGERVKKGEVVADGPATDMGELALGKNVLVAFMPWGGYNFEDSILISEKLLKEDTYTSIHIEELECVARDTKLGKEEITADIPNAGEEALQDLDESGIVRIGAEVNPGDILVGKVTPKGETQLSPEEKLLRAIFGEKAGDVRDTSLRVPHGIEGIVIDAKVFSRKGQERDERTKAIEEQEKARLLKNQADEIRIIQNSTRRKVGKYLIGKRAERRIADERKNRVFLDAKERIKEEHLFAIPFDRLIEIDVQEGKKVIQDVHQQLTHAELQINVVKGVYGDKLAKLKRGDELAPGVIKTVKVYIAMKRKLSVGDKMSGRHGNKGIISRILPEEDMPYMEDGTPVGIILNPLGVPSRMNVGQILETHLGWAAKGLGWKIGEYLEANYNPKLLRRRIREIYSSKEVNEYLDQADDDEVAQLARKLGQGIFVSVPVFDGASEAEIKDHLEKAGLPVSGQTTLYDGKTGEPFHQKITVGYMYLLKLHHLVDDKIHARSIGPYSLVTQQPLGGKAQFGGQRLGEMEVWALEAYGAAHSLQEFLTVKSDDVAGRTRVYEAIVKGEHTLEPGLPESFNVLVKELQSLCLDTELIEEKREEL